MILEADCSFPHGRTPFKKHSMPWKMDFYWILNDWPITWKTTSSFGPFSIIVTSTQCKLNHFSNMFCQRQHWLKLLRTITENIKFWHGVNTQQICTAYNIWHSFAITLLIMVWGITACTVHVSFGKYFPIVWLHILKWLEC